MADLNTIFAPLLVLLETPPPHGQGMPHADAVNFVLQIMSYVERSPTLSSQL